MKQFNRALGKLGEDRASEYLIKNGFKIIERNYSTKFGEIDLIAVKNNILRFIEVKLKKGEDFGTPEEMIGRNKLFQVNRMSQFYLMAKPEMAKKYDRYSIDAVCVVVNENEDEERIDLYENIGF
jgi:putative endonuclease